MKCCYSGILAVSNIPPCIRLHSLMPGHLCLHHHLSQTAHTVIYTNSNGYKSSKKRKLGSATVQVSSWGLQLQTYFKQECQTVTQQVLGTHRAGLRSKCVLAHYNGGCFQICLRTTWRFWYQHLCWTGRFVHQQFCCPYHIQHLKMIIK